MSESAPRDRSPHEPAGRVRTGIHTVHGRAFSARHVQAGSRAFDVLFRFVWGVPLGLVLASIARGGLHQSVVFETYWPHHPVSDSVALGLLIGVFLAPFALAYFRAQEKFARLRKEDRPVFKWVGRRVALFTFGIAYFALWALQLDSISLR